MKKFPFTLVLLSLLLQLNAQKMNEKFRLNIRKTNLPVKIDGIADDEAWEGTEVAKDFFMVLPMDTDKASDKSEIRMTYDDTNIYLVATFYNSVPGRYFVESMRRDFSFNDNYKV